jgi:hypothetical protein
VRKELLGVVIVAIVALAGVGLGQSANLMEDPTEEPMLVPDQGPDVPPGDVTTREEAPTHVATRNPVDTELRVFTAGTWQASMDVPEEDFDRVYIEYSSWPNHPDGDPWDRTFSVGVEGAEVLHGTTTRGNFTVYEDLTELDPLFEPGTTVDVTWYIDTWVRGQGIVTDVQFHFLEDPTPSTSDQTRVDAIESPFYLDRIEGAGDAVSGEVSFGDAAPRSAILEVFTSGHGDGEFWYLNAAREPTPPTFEVTIDDEPVGYLEAVPYVYALLGLDGGQVAEAFNQHAWWSGHKALDRAGVHTGVAEIPAYRAEIAPEDLDLLTGNRTVTVTQLDHGGVWPTSVNVLIDEPSPLPATPRR